MTDHIRLRRQLPFRWRGFDGLVHVISEQHTQAYAHTQTLLRYAVWCNGFIGPDDVTKPRMTQERATCMRCMTVSLPDVTEGREHG